MSWHGHETPTTTSWVTSSFYICLMKRVLKPLEKPGSASAWTDPLQAVCSTCATLSTHRQWFWDLLFWGAESRTPLCLTSCTTEPHIITPWPLDWTSWSRSTTYAYGLLPLVLPKVFSSTHILQWMHTHTQFTPHDIYCSIHFLKTVWTVGQLR